MSIIVGPWKIAESVAEAKAAAKFRDLWPEIEPMPVPVAMAHFKNAGFNVRRMIALRDLLQRDRERARQIAAIMSAST